MRILFVMGEESEGPHIGITRRGPHLPNFPMELIGGAEHSRVLTPHRAEWVQTWALWEERCMVDSAVTGCECLQEEGIQPLRAVGYPARYR